MRRYFRLNREILQNKHSQYFEQSKTRHDRAKIGLAGQHDRSPFKNYFEPCFTLVFTCHDVRSCDHGCLENSDLEISDLETSDLETSHPLKND